MGEVSAFQEVRRQEHAGLHAETEWIAQACWTRCTVAYE